MNEENEDAVCIDFQVARVAAPLLSGAQAAADDIRDTGADTAATSAAAARVRGLELADVLPSLETPADAAVLLFHMARIVAYANLPAAWQGLYEVPASTLREQVRVDSIAVPEQTAAGAATRWLLWLPTWDDGVEQTAALYQPLGRELVGPFDLQNDAASTAGSRRVGLLGFPRAQCVMFAKAPVLDRQTPRMMVNPTLWSLFVDASLALFAGLVDGATRRLVHEAYAYARTRKSAGRAILQHQAVALRLADLAIHQEALSLYLTGAVERCEPAGVRLTLSAIDTTHVGDLAFRIARDAVQLAAGHGYVEGLPFRRLFEQVRTLTVILTSFKAAMATPARLAG